MTVSKGLVKSAGFATGFAKGFGSTFGMSLQYMQEKKKDKKIEDASKNFQMRAQEYAIRKDKAWADGVYSREEREADVRWSIPFGTNLTEWVTKMSDESLQMSEEQIDGELEEIEAFIGLSEKLDFSNYDEMVEFRKNIKYPKALIKYDAALKSVKAKLDKDAAEVEAEAPKVEAYNSLKEFKAAMGDVPYEYNDDGQLRPKWVAPKDTPTPPKLNEYQMKVRDIENDKSLTDTEKKRGLYKVRTGLDIKVNNDEDDFTTVEGKRTADFGKQELFGYTAQDGILVAGLIPSRLVRTLSLGKPATQEEQDSVMYNWNARKEAVAKLGGAMAVEYIENIIGQMFKITKEKEIPKGGLLEDAFNFIKGENGTETETETNDTPATAEEVLKPGLDVNQKLALMATLPDSELKKAAQQAAEDDSTSVLYKALYDMCEERGLLD